MTVGWLSHQDLQENSHALYLHTHRSTGLWSFCANSPLLSALPQAAFALSGMNQAPIHEVPQLRGTQTQLCKGLEEPVLEGLQHFSIPGLCSRTLQIHFLPKSSISTRLYSQNGRQDSRVSELVFCLYFEDSSRLTCVTLCVVSDIYPTYSVDVIESSF